LIFVHGSGCTGKFLLPLAECLLKYRCVLIDLPDHGKSPFLDVLTGEEYIDEVAKFAAEFNHVILVGHSLGGTIVLGVAARNIPSVKKSVIISSASKFDKFDSKIQNMVEKHRIPWLHVCACLGSLNKLSVLRSLLYLDKTHIFLKDFAIDLRIDVTPVLSKIKIPVLILVGGDDILTIPEYSYQLKKQIPQAKLLVIPGFRHMLPVADRHNVAGVILRFIKSCDK
jgi:pimeloyl-ACP methyl ester carboxylesterase